MPADGRWDLIRHLKGWWRVGILKHKFIISHIWYSTYFLSPHPPPFFCYFSSMYKQSSFIFFFFFLHFPFPVIYFIIQVYPRIRVQADKEDHVFMVLDVY